MTRRVNSVCSFDSKLVQSFLKVEELETNNKNYKSKNKRKEFGSQEPKGRRDSIRNQPRINVFSTLSQTNHKENVISIKMIREFQFQKWSQDDTYVAFPPKGNDATMRQYH